MFSLRFDKSNIEEDIENYFSSCILDETKVPEQIESLYELYAVEPVHAEFDKILMLKDSYRKVKVPYFDFSWNVLPEEFPPEEPETEGFEISGDDLLVSKETDGIEFLFLMPCSGSGRDFLGEYFDLSLIPGYVSKFDLQGLHIKNQSTDSITLSYVIEIETIRKNGNKTVWQALTKEVEEKLKPAIHCLNSAIQKYNGEVHNFIEQTIREKAEAQQLYQDIADSLGELQMTEVDFIAEDTESESTLTREEVFHSVYISDNTYRNILKLISNCCTSMEKRPDAHAKYTENQIRDLLLTALSGIYQCAVGEAFRKRGKTDICIEREPEGTAAFIAEIKIWHGLLYLKEGISQLCKYTTWRDTKSALLLFNKSVKKFPELRKKVEDYLKEICETCIRQSENVWQCTYNTNEKRLSINVQLYNLYMGD